MTDTAINPVAPSRALARNAPSRALVSKQLKSYSAFTSEQALAAFTPRRFRSATPRRALEKMTCEPESPIQIP
jgi:hypothetical protein